MEQTLYSEPTQEQLQVAKEAKMYYKATYHNGKINHWQLTKIQEVKKACSWCGKQRTNI